MSLTRSTPILVWTALVAAACAEPQPTAPELDELAEAEGPLDLAAPMITAADLVDAVRIEHEPPSPGIGPLLVDEPDEMDVEPPMIFNARTGVSFGGGSASSLGRHDYTGNIGRVETTAHVAFQAQHLGSQSAERQEYTPFLLDLGRVKSIWVRAEVFTDKECGLSVQGESKHYASWQFFQGTDVQDWGQAVASTQRAPASQTPCGDQQSQNDPTGDDRPAQGFTCTYLITYDMVTGEVVDAERLFCSTTGDLF